MRPGVPEAQRGEEGQQRLQANAIFCTPAGLGLLPRSRLKGLERRPAEHFDLVDDARCESGGELHDGKPSSVVGYATAQMQSAIPERHGDVASVQRRVRREFRAQLCEPLGVVGSGHERCCQNGNMPFQERIAFPPAQPSAPARAKSWCARPTDHTPRSRLAMRRNDDLGQRLFGRMNRDGDAHRPH